MFLLFFQGIATVGEQSASNVVEPSAVDKELSHTPPTPKRSRNRPTPPLSSSPSLQKDAILGAAYERMMKEDDEWDKTALLLAEHMRNAVKEFPILADEFRSCLLQTTLDVHKKRSETRIQNALIVVEYSGYNKEDE